VRLLLVHLGPLGEVLPAVPVVHDIRVHFPDATVDWVAEPAVAPLLRRVDGLHEVVEAAAARWSAGWWKAAVRREWQALRARVRREPYDVVIDLQGRNASAWVAHQARGVRFGVGNRSEGSEFGAFAGWFVDHAIRVEPRLHLTDRARTLVAQVLGRPLDGAPVYGLRVEAADRRPGRPTVVFAHAGASDAALWPVAQWVQLGKRLIAAGWNIALPQSDEAEQTRAELIAAGLQYEGQLRVEVWPALRLETLLQWMAATQAVIGVAGTLSQIGMALDLPQVQLHNGTTAWRAGPLVTHGRAWQVAVEARPTPPLEAVWSAWNGVLSS
jgi:heptosyltransferase-1